MKELFDPQIYVQRQIAIQLQQWMDGPLDANSNRLISLIGATGIGKSWILADAYQQAYNNKKIVALWLDLAPNAIHPLTKNPLPNSDTENGRIEWLKQCIADTNEQCHKEIVSFNPTTNFAANFNLFLKSLCSHNPPLSPVLFVDGFDELMDQTNNIFLQEQVLATYWGYTCTRLLLARRDQQMLIPPILKWNEEIFSLIGLTEDERNMQITHRSRHFSVPDPDQLKTVLKNYITPNPFLNTCLFNRANRKKPPDIYQEDIETCMDTYMNRAGLTSSPNNLVRRLIKELPKEWTNGDLRQQIPPIRVDDTGMETLFQAGIIQQIEGSSSYQIDEGLYYLLQQLQQSHLQEEKDE